MKKALLLILAIGLLLIFTACASQPAPQPAPEPTPTPEAPEADEPTLPAEINLAVLKGPTGVGAVYLMEQAEAGQNNYRITMVETPEQVVALLANGSVDIAALPTNLAANLYTKTNGNVQMAAITTSGMLYLLEAGESVQSWEDLRGKTIYATGRGANPEYILDYLLRDHELYQGVTVQVEFKSEHAELATLLASGQVGLAMLPEPFVTSAMMQNDELRIVYDLSAEWQATGVGDLAMTCIAARRDYIAANPEAMAAFLTDMEQSINYALDNVAEAAALCEKHGVIPKAAVAENAIPRCNLTFIAGEEMKEAIAAYYEVLFNANPQAIGGALPNEDFYWTH